MTGIAEVDNETLFATRVFDGTAAHFHRLIHLKFMLKTYHAIATHLFHVHSPTRTEHGALLLDQQCRVRRTAIVVLAHLEAFRNRDLKFTILGLLWVGG